MTMLNKSSVLILSPFYEPNVGGVETSLKELTSYLLRDKRYNIYVLTYQPITTEARGASLEKKGNLEVKRIPWIGYNLFHKLEPYPILEFLYITPWLFLNTFIFMLKHRYSIRTIHAQGFNAAFISRIISMVFKTRTVVSIHAIYNLKPSSVFTKLVRWTLKKADKVLALSLASKRELVNIGLLSAKIDISTNWVDQGVFKPLDKSEAKKDVNWEGRFIVLFVGRFIKAKGMDLLLEVARQTTRDIYFAFIGDGPRAEMIRKESMDLPNVLFVGKVNNQNLPLYYNAANILCVPSQYEEGFGRVILEAVSCGTPVVGANRGGIPEAIDGTVGVLVEPNVENLRRVIENLYDDRETLNKFSGVCRRYAEERFSERNALAVVKCYA